MLSGVETSMEPGFLKPGNTAATGAGGAFRCNFNGARLPEARKRAGGLEGGDAHSCTSMEPGFLKPGNTMLNLRMSPGRWRTSMEPGFLKPGNENRKARFDYTILDFNGARLPEARKHRSRRRQSGLGRHFNGARLPEARKQGGKKLV